MPCTLRPKTAHTPRFAGLACLLGLVCSPAWADPAIALFSSLGRPDAVTVHGRVVAEQPHHSSGALGRNLRRFTAGTASGVAVQVAVGGAQAQGVTDSHGLFSVEVRFPEARAPGVYLVTARVAGATGHGAVQLLNAAAPFLLISDLDDTISVTQVLHPTKMASAVLLQDSSTQPAVPGMAAFYRCLMADKQVAPALAVVTGTPVELAERTAAFLFKHDFPFAALYPRLLGPDTLSGYKQPVIRRLLKQLPQPAICVGDSGEHDPEVYREMTAEFPGRILQTYIRNVGHAEDPKRFDGQFVFTEAPQAAAHAVAHGWMTQACFDRAFPGTQAR